MPSSNQPASGSLSDRALTVLHAELWLDAVPEAVVGPLKELADKLHFRASRNRNGSRASESEMLEEMMRAAVEAAPTPELRTHVLDGFGMILTRLLDVHTSLLLTDLGPFEDELETEALIDGEEDASGVVAMRRPATHGSRWYRDSLRQEQKGRRCRASFVRQFQARSAKKPARRARTVSRRERGVA